jgi:hypothetical protein
MGRYLVGSFLLTGLLGFSPELFPVALASQRLLRPALVPGLEIERVFLDVLDDVLLLHLPLESAESALNGLPLLNLDFSHACNTPFAGGK